jgi:dihydrofolate reductase
MAASPSSATIRPVEGLPPGCEAWSGEIAELAPRVRESPGGDVWVIGGSVVQQQFLDAGALDRIEVFVVPVLLGTGVPLWPPSPRRHRLALRSAEALPGGLARLDYDVGPLPSS